MGLFQNVRGRNRSENFNTSDERTEEGVVMKISAERNDLFFFIIYFFSRGRNGEIVLLLQNVRYKDWRGRGRGWGFENTR